MGDAFVVKHADELLDTEFMPKWQHREALGSLPRAVWGMILGEFVRSGGPVRVDEVAARLPQHPVAEVTQAIRQLDEDDMILVEESLVTIVYPFASRATPFKVLLADGRERYAVCAIDALGIAPMLGQSITIRSHCHHCRAPLQIDVRPDGPIAPLDVMVWVGERGDANTKACASFCLTLNFFRSQDHLRSWRLTHLDVAGAAAPLADAFTLGAHIFGTLLRETVTE